MIQNVYSKKSLLEKFAGKMAFLALFFIAFSVANAQSDKTEMDGGQLRLIKSAPVGLPTNPNVNSLTAADPDALYSNKTTFAGSVFGNEGSEIQVANGISRMVMDSIKFILTAPYSIKAFTFSVSNIKSAAVSARPRVRFYANDGPNDGPGTYIAGFSFNPISFAPNSINTFSGTVTPFTVTQSAIWAGLVFDNNNGATGATIADLDSLGQGIFNPIDIGASSNTYFRTTAAGSFLSNNPPGTLGTFTAPTLANFGWEFVSNTPLPISLEYFKGFKTGSNLNLTWKINCYNSPRAIMALERSNDSRKFNNIYNLNVDAARCLKAFDYTDASPLSGINYYRLKTTDADGKITYSSTVALINKQNGFSIIGVQPNLVTGNNAIINVTAAEKTKLQLVVTNSDGKRVMTQTENIIAGSTQFQMNFSKLTAGNYVVTGYTETGAKASARFIKE